MLMPAGLNTTPCILMGKIEPDSIEFRDARS